MRHLPEIPAGFLVSMWVPVGSKRFGTSSFLLRFLVLAFFVLPSSLYKGRSRCLEGPPQMLDSQARIFQNIQSISCVSFLDP